jgi:hypothetical protein
VLIRMKCQDTFQLFSISLRVCVTLQLAMLVIWVSEPTNTFFFHFAPYNMFQSVYVLNILASQSIINYMQLFRGGERERGETEVVNFNVNHN